MLIPISSISIPFPSATCVGVWVALEDIHEDAGPLIYYPGSHRLPSLFNEEMGLVPDFGEGGTYLNGPKFEKLWKSLIADLDLQARTFTARKGQAAIWAANLLHGGAAQRDRKRTRHSQVTHYFFEGCAYYTPLSSMPFLGGIDYRSSLVDVRDGEPVTHEINGVALDPERFGLLSHMDRIPWSEPTLPADFDPESYLELNPDVAEAEWDAVEHYLRYGRFEHRHWKAGSALIRYPACGRSWGISGPV